MLNKIILCVGLFLASAAQAVSYNTLIFLTDEDKITFANSDTALVGEGKQCSNEEQQLIKEAHDAAVDSVQIALMEYAQNIAKPDDNPRLQYFFMGNSRDEFLEYDSKKSDKPYSDFYSGLSSLNKTVMKRGGLAVLCSSEAVGKLTQKRTGDMNYQNKYQKTVPVVVFYSSQLYKDKEKKSALNLSDRLVGYIENVYKIQNDSESYRLSFTANYARYLLSIYHDFGVEQYIVGTE